MPPAVKNKAPLVLGIISIAFSMFIAIIGLILGIIGVSLSFNYTNNSEFDYKIEKILNIVGIVIAVINMVITFVFLMSQVR